MRETPQNEQEDSLTEEIEPNESDVKEPMSPALARLIEEVRNEKVESLGAYNRYHNRHNRSR